jgi:hypothetical protein
MMNNAPFGAAESDEVETALESDIGERL